MKMRPSREDIAGIAARLGGQTRVRELRDWTQTSRDEYAAKLAENDIARAKLQDVIDTCDEVLADIAAVLGEIGA